MSIRSSSRSQSLALLVPTLALSMAACSSGSGGSGSFEVNNTTGSVSADAVMIVRGAIGVYFTEEMLVGPPGGASQNGDTDRTDFVAHVVQLNSRSDVNTGVAAESAEILGSDVFLDVLEFDDNIDWNGDAVANDRVLLHFDRATETVTFVDTLDPSLRNLALLVVGERLYYSAEAAALAGDESSLRYIQNGAPLVINQVANSTGGGTLTPVLIGEDEGLIFLALDETVEGRTLNSDMDSTDTTVLALLDGHAPAASIKNTGLALLDENQPMDAELTGVNDWTLAFLVDEAAEGGLSLNDQSTFANPILVASCAATNDVDAGDQVLHFLEFATFMTGATLPVNTGLAGSGRVIAMQGAVATLSPEADSLCDLNEDLDTSDIIARWTSTSLPLMPAVTVTEMHAIVTSIPGGSMGLSSLGNRLIGIISESGDQANYDLRSDNNDLVAWLDPAVVAPAWTFRHQSNTASNIGTGIFEDTDGDGIGDPGLGASEPYAGASWMAPEETFGRLGITFQESVPGSNPQIPTLNTNLLCGFFQKDLDKVDSLPVWLDFEAGPILDFDGVGFAVEPINAGVTTHTNTAFFVVSEEFDNTDYNGDADFTDTLLFRNPTNQCQPVLMSSLRGFGMPVLGPVLHTDGEIGAMFVVYEGAEGIDLNGDNDSADFVVRYFRF